MKNWIKLITMAVLLIVIASGGILAGCGKNPQESLRERATEWSALLDSLPVANEQEDVKNIESFLEPSAVRTERAKEFYRNWTSNETDWRFVQSSVDEVSVGSDGKSGTVRLTTVYEWQGEEILGVKKGDRRTGTQVLNWRLIGKMWYRTMEAAEIK